MLIRRPRSKILLALVAAAFFAAGGVVTFGRVLKDRPLEYDDSQLHLSNVKLLVEQNIPLIVHNPNWNVAQIVGCQGDGCGPGGCVYGIVPETLDLAPGETKEILVRYRSPPIAGPFEREFIIYSATNTLNEHKLKVTGVAVKAKKKEEDSHHEDTKDTKKDKEGSKSDAPEQDS